MWKKTAIILFVVGVLTFSFGVKKTWAINCCANGSDVYTTIGGVWGCLAPATNAFVPGTLCPAGQGCDVAVSPPQCNAAIPPAGPPAPPKSSPFDPCKNLAANALMGCRLCTGVANDGSFDQARCGSGLGPSCGTWTSLGCIPNDPPNLVGWILGFGSGIAGGIAFLLILFGAGQIVLSAGVPEKVAAGKEIITSAVIGLVFIFLSVLILKIIGVQILGIPGWS